MGRNYICVYSGYTAHLPKNKSTFFFIFDCYTSPVDNDENKSPKPDPNRLVESVSPKRPIPT